MSDASDEPVIGEFAEVLGGQARRARGMALGREGEDRHDVPLAPREGPSEQPGRPHVDGHCVSRPDACELPSELGLAHGRRARPVNCPSSAAVLAWASRERGRQRLMVGIASGIHRAHVPGWR